MKNITTICSLVFLMACEAKVTTTYSGDSTTSAEKVLDTIENNINKGWDSVKASVKKGSESLNIDGDSLKNQINETLRKGSEEIQKGADTLKNKIDGGIKRTFPQRNDTLKK